VQWVRVLVDHQTPTEIPMRVKAQSDDLPEHIDEVIFDYLLRIRWLGL
jgi:hypothetical protein